jgi:hypothetical protein
MELLFLANMYREIRYASIPHEQARAVLADLVNFQIYREARSGAGDERA